jgi:hypothetical protein
LKAYLSGRAFSTAGVKSSVAWSTMRWRMSVGLGGIGDEAKEVWVPLDDGVLEVVGEGELAPDAEDGAEGQGVGDRHREEAVERPRCVGGGAGDCEEARGGGVSDRESGSRARRSNTRRKRRRKWSGPRRWR